MLSDPDSGLKRAEPLVKGRLRRERKDGMVKAIAQKRTARLMSVVGFNAVAARLVYSVGESRSS